MINEPSPWLALAFPSLSLCACVYLMKYGAQDTCFLLGRMAFVSLDAEPKPGPGGRWHWGGDVTSSGLYVSPIRSGSAGEGRQWPRGRLGQRRGGTERGEGGSLRIPNRNRSGLPASSPPSFLRPKISPGAWGWITVAYDRNRPEAGGTGGEGENGDPTARCLKQDIKQPFRGCSPARLLMGRVKSRFTGASGYGFCAPARQPGDWRECTSAGCLTPESFFHRPKRQPEGDGS